MKESYYIDSCNFSIDKFRNILKSKEILPGRIILKDRLDDRFDLFESLGIKTLSDLLDALKTKSRIDQFSKVTGLSVEYLTILRREANSYISVPVRLRDLPFVESEIIERLEQEGIRDTKQLFDAAIKATDRRILSNQLGLPLDKIHELVQLCDLMRITGVGPVFARIILDSDIHSVGEFLSIDAFELFERLTNTNNEKVLTKSKFTIKDIEYCIELGKDLPITFDD